LSGSAVDLISGSLGMLSVSEAQIDGVGFCHFLCEKKEKKDFNLLPVTGEKGNISIGKEN
jgi:hypothetical protein